MPRKPRCLLWSEEACFHFFNRGHYREVVFRDDDDRRYFLDLWLRCRERFSLRIYHYCLMDNHFHVLVQLRDARQVSALGAGLLRAYVHYYNRRYGFVGHLWQGRFKSPAVQKETYLLSCGRYIERNPLEVDMVKQPRDYAWSSSRAYAMDESDALLAENSYYLEMGKTPARRQKLWRELLFGDDPKEANIDVERRMLGDAEFVRRTEEQRSRSQSRRVGRPPSVGNKMCKLSP